jgi:group I intron endonuclease
MSTIIYTLSDETSIRYIGKTKQIKKRYQSHINESYLLRTHKEKWINKVLSNGGIIIIEPLEICDDSTANEVECYWISQFRCWGFNLVNLTDGGDGGSPMLGKKHSLESKIKMSETHKKQNRHTGGWNKGLTIPNDIKEKIRISSLGRIHNEETKIKISNKLKGIKRKPMSDETKIKISKKKKGVISPNKGKKQTDEVKRKISLSKLGTKRNDEVKKTLSNSKKIIWKIKNPSGEIMEFFGYNSFKDFVIEHSLDVSVTTLKSYGKNKNWEIIEKIKI